MVLTADLPDCADGSDLPDGADLPDAADGAYLPDGHHEDDSKDDRKHCGHQVVHNGPDSNLRATIMYYGISKSLLDITHLPRK